MDKNRFRYLEKDDLRKVSLERRGLIRRVFDIVKERLYEMVKQIDGIASGEQSGREDHREDTRN